MVTRALRRPGRRRGVSEPGAAADVVTSTTHKSCAARGGIILMNDEGIAKKINSAVFPGLQGGPLMRDRRQGGRLQGGARPSSSHQQQVAKNAIVLTRP
jgi:glycine hydroxymethyltransferase